MNSATVPFQPRCAESGQGLRRTAADYIERAGLRNGRSSLQWSRFALIQSGADRLYNPGTLKKGQEDDMGVGAGKMDSTREAIADRLHSAAGTIREQASAGSEAFTSGAESVASRIDASANYLASRDGRKMMGDLLSVVKRYPAQSLLVAGLVGFMVSRVFRSRD